jgi:calcium-dependent protein kinase
MDHPNVLKIYESFDDHYFYVLVTEIIAGGELAAHVGKEPRFCGERSAKVIHTLLKTLQYLHGKGIVHRDIKPANMMLESSLDPQLLKLVDFGTAGVF